MIRHVLRPGWVMGIAWLIVLLICPWLSAEWRMVFAVISAIILTISVCIPTLRHIRAIPLIAAVCLLAMLSYQAACFWKIQPVEACVGQTLSLYVRVVEKDNAVLLEVQDGDLPHGTRVAFYPNDPELVLDKYDEFTADFELQTFSTASRLSELMRLAGGTRLRVASVKTQQIEDTLTRGDIPWTDVFVRVRDRLCADIEQRLDGDVGAVVTGICYGADEHVSDAAVSNFRACGVAHLFAVSGLHMTVLMHGFLSLLYRLRVNRTLRALLGAVFLLGFMAVVGFSASVVRAGVMHLIILFGNCLRRRADTRNSLGFALLLLLLPAPFAAYDAGLLLSFSATFGLLCWTKPIEGFLLGHREPQHFARVRKGIAAAAAVSLAAMLATLPVQVLYFGRISLVAVPANLLTTLPAEGVLIVGCAASVLSVSGVAVLAQPLLMVAGLLSRYLLWICEKISAFSFATVATPSGFLVLWVVGVYVLFWVGRRVFKKQGLSALGGVCVCILGIGILLHRGVTYRALRVGSASTANDLAVVVSYRGSTVAVTAPERVSSLYDMVDLLYTFGVSRIDALFVVGGTQPTTSYIPIVFGTYLTEDTQVVDGAFLRNRSLMLGECFEACWEDDALRLEWDGLTLLFLPNGNAVGTADAVFSAGDVGIRVQTGNGLLPLAADTQFLAFKDGKWFIAE